jgi:hypothetical protein
MIQIEERAEDAFAHHAGFDFADALQGPAGVDETVEDVHLCRAPRSWSKASR